MRKILLALSPAMFALGMYACAGSPTAPSGMSNDVSRNGAPTRTETAVGNVRQFDNPVDADAVEIGPDGQSVSNKDKDKDKDKDKNGNNANANAADNKDKDKEDKTKNDNASKDKEDKTKNDNANKGENKNESDSKNSDASESNGESAAENSNNGVGSRSPSLTTNVNTVAPGGNVVVTLANGSPGANQWIALAAANASDSSYLLSIQVGPAVTSRTWTVRMPMTAGTYEFRLFLNSNRGHALREGARSEDSGVPKGPSQNTRAASATVVVTSGTTPPVNDPPAPVVGNDPPPVVGTDPPPPVVVEPPPPPPPVVEPTPPPPAPVVEPPPPPPPPSTDPAISVSSQTVTGGTSMSATLINGLGGPFDWLTYAPVGSPDTEYWDWTYVPGGLSTYTWTFTVPAIPGTYEIRLLLNGGYTKVATSPPITVK